MHAGDHGQIALPIDLPQPLGGNSSADCSISMRPRMLKMDIPHADWDLAALKPVHGWFWTRIHAGLWSNVMSLCQSIPKDNPSE